jgi:DNA-binding SARP family transcriptional activator/WD40 repeat protein
MSTRWDGAVTASAARVRSGGHSPASGGELAVGRRVNVLGPIELVVDGAVVEFTSPRLRQLLALLVVHANTVVSTDRLIDVMWPNDDDAQALRTLRTNVWRLRNLLGPGADAMLLTRQGGYVLALSADDHDAEQFETLAASGSAALIDGDASLALGSLDAALALWRGRAFEGYETEDWARPAAVRLEDIRISTAEHRIEALLLLGRTDDAISEAARIVSEHPLRERTRALHMRALYRGQRQAEALRAYAEFRSTLAEELGVEPSPQLRQLERAILDHDLASVGGVTPVAVARGYELSEAIATTPVTVTYRATAPRSSEPVLVTVVDQTVACDPSYVRAFEAEAQRMRAVTHEHLVEVTDCWRDAQGAYFVTPTESNSNLFGAPLDAVSFLSILDQVTSAVQHLHTSGLAHGHLDAESIQIGPGSQVSIRPGGLACGLRGASTGVDQRGVALWLAAIAPADLGSDARDVIERGATRDPDEQFGSVYAFGEALVQAVTCADGAPADVPVVDRNPYVGLRSFLESDADVFFGRDRLVKAMLARLSEPGPEGSLVAVVGASGSGKSSVVHAGLVAALREGGVGDSVDWFIARMTPGDDPVASCRTALDAVAVRPLDGFDDERSRGGDVLTRCAAAALPADSTLLLIVDQFEEVFSSAVSPHDCDEFIDMLTAAVTAPTDGVRVVLTLRADFYDRPLRYPRFGQLLQRCHVVVTAPVDDDLVAAIEGPAALVGLEFEPGLVRLIVRDFEHHRSLPLLQHALVELVDRRESNRLTVDAYEEIGGIEGGLARRAEAVYADCPISQQALVRRSFTRLVTVGEGTGDTRRRVLRRELDDLAGSSASVDDVLERFGAARLLTFDRDPQSRQPTVEIAHEALIGTWDRLAAWIDEDRDALLLVRHVGTTAEAWADSGRDAAELYRGARLESVAAWVAGHPGALGSIESEFVAASEALAARETAERTARADEQRRHHLRLRRLTVAACCAAALALVAGSLAMVQSRRAEDRRVEARAAEGNARDQADLAAEQRVVAEDARVVADAARDDAERARATSDVDRLVAQATADADTIPARALLLAAAAYDLSPSSTTAGAMQSAIVAQPAGFAGFIPTEGETSQVQIGDSVMLRHTYDSVEIIDRESRAVTAVIPDPTENTRFALSADDGVLALAGPSVRVYDVSDGSLLAELDRPVLATDVDFDPTDRSRLAIGYDDGTTEIVAWESDVVATTLAPQGDLVRVVAFSPDGRHLATATGSRESAVRIWDATTGLPTSANLGGVGTSLYHADLAFDRAGTRLASVDRGGVGRMWTVPEGVAIGRTATTYGVEALHSLEFEGDDVIVASGPSGVLRRWSATTGADLGSVEPHAGLVTSIAIDPDGRTLLVGGNEQLALFDLSGNTPGHSIDPFPSEIAALVARGASVPATISADGRTVALLAGGGVWVWDRSDDLGTARPIPAATAGSPIAAAVSPDGSLLAVPYLDFGSGVTEIVVFDVPTLSVTDRLASPRAPIVAFSPDNRMLAIADIAYPRTPTLDVHDLDTGKRSSLVADLEAVTDDVDPLRGSWVSSLSFSLDSRLLAAANHRGAAMIWDTTTLEPVGEPLSRGGGAVLDLEFGVSGDTIAVTSASNDITLLDVVSRDRIGPVMQSPSGLSIGLAMSPDATLLLSGGSDGIQLWDVAGGVAVGRPYPAPTPLGPPLQWLGTESFAVVTDRGVETWTTDPDDWRTHVCELAGRSLSDDEWERFGTADPTPRC